MIVEFSPREPEVCRRLTRVGTAQPRRQAGERSRPSSRTKALLSATTGAEIRSLQAAARAADTEYQFTLTRSNRAPSDEGNAALQRMVAALRCLLDDGIEDEADVKLANLEARHDNPTTNDALASAYERRRSRRIDPEPDTAMPSATVVLRRSS